MEDAFGGTFHGVEDSLGDAVHAFQGFEGNLEEEVEFAVGEVENLASSYGLSALLLFGMIYTAVVLTVVLCEAARCLAGSPAFGALDEDGQSKEADHLLHSTPATDSREATVGPEDSAGRGRVVSAML